MEPNQLNNINSYSLSSSSSGNFQNDSKKSEKLNSKKSILRKEGSQSKNKDKHATFVDPSMNQVTFYLPDISGIKKNDRISLNTVSEEPEPNSRSGSELINNRILSSNRVLVKTEQKLNFDNNGFNVNNLMFDSNKEMNNRTFTNINNNFPSFYDNTINNINIINHQENKNEPEIIESKPIIFKNQNIKKPTSRKTLDSDYLLNDFSKSNNMNNIPEQMQNQENEIMKEPPSKALKIRLSNSGRNSFLSDNNINTSLDQSKNNIVADNNSINRPQMKNNDTSINSDNSTNERIKREQQTKINTEVNKNLFNINAPRNSLVGINDITSINSNNIPSNNLIDNMSNQINELITKNNNKKPNFRKRITMAMTNDDDLFIDDDNFNTNKEIQETNMYNNNNIIQQIDNNAYNNINTNNIILQNREKKMPKKNQKRITMATNPFDDEQNLFNDDIASNQQESIPIMNNSKKLCKDYPTNYNTNEEIAYVEPKIVAENKNINLDIYEKYLKYNNFIFPKSESKINNITSLNFPKKDESDASGSQTTKKEKQMINSDNLLENLQKLNQNNINKNLPNSKNSIPNLNFISSPLIELINDKSFTSKGSMNSFSKQDEKYNLVLNENENFDIEKEITNQINFIEKNLEEKEKNWREKIINNAERHTQFESEISKNKNDLNNIEYRINEIINQKNDLIKNKTKYETLSEKAQKLNDGLTSAGIEIKDIEHIMYKEMNCLLFTVMIKNKLVFKFLISDNIWYEKNVSGESDVTFIGVLKTEVFSNYFEDEAIINKDKNMNELIQKYYNEIINKVFPNEYEKISIHDLSRKYYFATQISICFLHILKIINQVSLIDPELEIHTQDLKKYFLKFNYVDIFSSKIIFIYELNIENPFSGNCLNSVEVEKNDYILNNFDEYRNDTLNLIWKYFNPQKIQINYNYFYNLILMLNYIDKVRVFKKEINDDYIFNVMQGNIKPKEDEFDEDENNNFDNMELSKQLEIIYGKNFLEQLSNINLDIDMENKEEREDNDKYIDIESEIGKNENNKSKDNDDEEIILDLPSSKDDN